ncbi:MAG: hypothetical protein KC592_14270 [Nitrospira sp.]|nr:hypothetical protein [Nitrospira sp.]HNP29935.1 hypothetical protein [Nitrospirales bacterium]
MSIMDWTVIIGGLTAIAWVNWYFFLAQAMAGKRIQNTAEIRKSSPR